MATVLLLCPQVQKRDERIAALEARVLSLETAKAGGGGGFFSRGGGMIDGWRVWIPFGMCSGCKWRGAASAHKGNRVGSRKGGEIADV